MRAFLDRLRPLAPVPIRLVLAVLFAYWGFHKVHGGMEKFTATVTGFGFPPWSAQVAAWSELAGGVLVGIGLLTRLAALSLVGVMVVAIWKVKLHSGIGTGSGLELPLLCLAGALSLVLSGAGRPSVDAKIVGGGRG